MKEFKKLLFPVDLSESAQKLVPYVMTVADKFDAEIHLIFVGRVFEHLKSIYVPHPSIKQVEGEIAAGGERKIKEFAEEYIQPHRPCKTKVVIGDIAEEIIKYVESEGIDLIVMGTHGRKGLDRLIFGSVAEKVVKTSPVPVMSINPLKVPLEE